MSFIKHDQNKPPMHLVPPRALRAVAQVMGFGAQKYAELNWTKCDDPMRLVAAALRHINEQVQLYHDTGSTLPEYDDESLLPSLAHAAASVLMALDLMLKEGDHDEEETGVSAAGHSVHAGPRRGEG